MPANDAEVHVLLVRKTPGARLGVRLHSKDVASHITDPQWRLSRDDVTPVIEMVDAGSEAERAGLMQGDEIVSISGQTKLNNVQAAALLREAEGVFTVAVARMPLAADTGEMDDTEGGTFEDITIKVHKPWADMSMGVEMTKLTDGEIVAVVISGVRVGGAGHAAGLQVEDQLLSVKTETGTIAHVQSAMEVAKLMRSSINNVEIVVRRYKEPPAPEVSASGRDARASGTGAPGAAAAAEATVLRMSRMSMSATSAGGGAGGRLPRYGDYATGVAETSWFARISRVSSGDLRAAAPPREFEWQRRTGNRRTRISFVQESAGEASVAGPPLDPVAEPPKKTFAETMAPVVNATQTVGQWLGIAGRATGQGIVKAGRATGQGIEAFLRELDDAMGDDDEPHEPRNRRGRGGGGYDRYDRNY